MIMLNNIIYYCEILGIKNIFLNPDYDWYIKNKIISDKINITIIPISQINCNNDKILCISLVDGFLFNPIVIKPEIRITILKNEIKRNLPNIKVDQNDLFIHIRSGNIFNDLIIAYYAQPPLCFYQKILYNFKFKNIYIISENNNNPVINKLIDEFPNIIFNYNNVKKDISYLIKAYNLVGSVSSFLLTSIKFNDNLKRYWEYDIYKIHQKILHLHHDFFFFLEILLIIK